ncbi:hypothetical protein RDI58_004243 [Solanum bulbocastanum]|uniref:Uncharacterized protein n=1 Tax=Solanum bulbocastanum TaxID=147425 RepID=A0AAN8YLE4_SOLBU
MEHVINMVEVTIYFHYGGEWLTNPEQHYDKGWVHYWRGYDPDLISFIDLCQNNREVGSKIGCCEEWKDDGFSPKSELLSIEYLKISRVCKAKQPTKKLGKQPAKQRKETAEDDDEDPRLRPRTISEEAFITRLRNRQNPQEPIESRVIGFRGDKYGISEPTNLPIAPTSLTWNGNDVITTNQLQKLRPNDSLAGTIP